MSGDEAGRNEGRGEEEKQLIDDFLWTLANRRRRDVLSVLQTVDDSITVSELAHRMANRTAEQTVDDWRLELHHQHLPALASIGVIEHQSNGVVLVDEKHESVTGLLAAIEEYVGRG